MNKRDIVLKIMDQIEGWADDNDIAVSTIEQIELAERIYNSELEMYQTPPDALKALKDLLAWANIHDEASEQARQVRDNAIAAIEACK